MRIMLATAHPYIPEIAGGAQSNMHELAVALLGAGHHVTIFCGFMGAGSAGLVGRIKLKVLRRRYIVDEELGYSVYRAWFPWEVASEVARDVKPDIVVAQSGLPAKISSSFRKLGIPVIIHFHNVEDDDLVGVDKESASAYISNSKFTSDFVSRQFGLDSEIIVPSFFPDLYRVNPEGSEVTFINPHPKKGRDLAIEIVKLMPQYNFLFVRSWTLSPDDEDILQDALKKFSNLRVIGPVRDMRLVYSRTRLLIIPSVWEEAWGRVATEAQFSGIPVIGSCRGGIPEAVGPGGVIMPLDSSPHAWSLMIQGIMENPDLYSELSRKALTYSERREILIDYQVEKMIEIAQSVLKTYKSVRYS